MQTLFKNPLAGPGILGISSGASLGVAVFTLAGGLGLSTAIGFVYAEMNLLFAASLGSFFTLVVILLFSNYIKNNVSLLIVGIMIGYIASSLIGFLQFASQQQQLQSFVLWGLGSFSNVSNQQLPLLSFLTLIGVILSLLFIKPLNLLLLGDNYAANLGINIKRTRFYLILISGLLTAVSTVYAGPIAFIGLAVPHLSRMIFKTSEHKIVLPGLILVGIAIALACNIISKVPGFDQAIPINTVTSLFGAPLVVYFILKNSRVKINHS
jgi:iron complex transport system permease protein